jgi:two-component system KDP operon response regulator KdpE
VNVINFPTRSAAEVLVIEEDSFTANSIAQSLSTEGYNITLASTGEEGLAQLREHTYALVVADQVMSEGDGDKICHLAKKRDPLLPVIIIGMDSPADGSTPHYNFNADVYLPKPLDPDIFLTQVKALQRAYDVQLFLAHCSQQLQLVNQIGRHITAILDLDGLLWEVIHLTQSAFDLDCAGVVLLEDNSSLWRFVTCDETGHLQDQVTSLSLEHVGLPTPVYGVRPAEASAKLAKAVGDLAVREATAMTSTVIVPIVHGEALLGVLFVGRNASDSFDSKDRLILGTLAGQLAVAIANARLVTAQRRETQVAQTLAHVAQLANQAGTIDELAQAMVDAFPRLTGIAHSAIGFWQTEHGIHTLKSFFTDGSTAGRALHDSMLNLDSSLQVQLIQANEPIVGQLVRGRVHLKKGSTAFGVNTQELLVVPIQRGERATGVLLFVSKLGQRLDAYIYALGVGVAHQLAVAVENANLLVRLQNERSQMEAVLSSMHSGVCLVNDTGQVVYCNPQLEKLLGVDRATFAGHAYGVLLEHVAAHCGNTEKAHLDLHAALDGLEAFPVVDVTLPQPELVHLRFHFFPVRDNVGHYLGWGSIINDVTRDRAIIDQMSGVLSGISYELRLPLAAIKGFVAMLSDDRHYWTAEGQQAFLKSINESADQLGRLIENVLELSRLEAGFVWLRRRTVAIGTLIDRSVQYARCLAEDCEFVVLVAPGLPELELDPLRIEQVLRNLLVNAIDRSPRHSKIAIQAERREQEITIGIKDRGASVPHEQLAHFFDRFFETKLAHGQRSSSTSLGLYISRELVMAHGGRIWATGEPEHGVSVWLTLPLDNTVSQNTPVKGTEDLRKPARQPEVSVPAERAVPTLLLVDDDLAALRVFKAQLELEGFRVFTAHSGQAALDMAAHQAFDLILLDLVLPDQDGFQVCEQLRSFSAVPIIMITGKAAEQDKIRGLSIGADDYLIKPFSDKELLARMRAVLRRVQTRTEAGEQVVLQFGDLAIDLVHRRVRLRDRQVNLSPFEYKLLVYLATHPGKILTHQELLTEVWGAEYRDDIEYLWVNVSRLRRKIEDTSNGPHYILTDPRIGYHFCER